jgi:hypothetical protein
VDGHAGRSKFAAVFVRRQKPKLGLFTDEPQLEVIGVGTVLARERQRGTTHDDIEDRREVGRRARGHSDVSVGIYFNVSEADLAADRIVGRGQFEAHERFSVEFGDPCACKRLVACLADCERQRKHEYGRHRSAPAMNWDVQHAGLAGGPVS